MTGGRDGILSRLERRIGHEFADRNLLKRALTHSSATAGRPAGSDYERLEFLGDRVLALIVADMLMRAYPRSREGDLSRRLAVLVRKEACAAVAAELELGEAITLGAGQGRSRVPVTASILGDACEALIGALFLDGGLESARRFIEGNWRTRMLDEAALLRDAKSTLQEWAQARGLREPTYELIGQSGPQHAPRLRLRVLVEGLAPEEGEGGSRREAEQKAATAMLVREGIWKREEA
jgi:ribonuclease-3